MEIRFDRLRKVVEAVRNAPEREFDLNSWDCGTTACAMGWYMRQNEIDFSVNDLIFSDAAPMWRTVANHFGISVDQAQKFFHPDSYNYRGNRRRVIARIDRFILDHDTAPVIELKPEAATVSVA